jgi:hypothetical protein
MTKKKITLKSGTYYKILNISEQFFDKFFEKEDNWDWTFINLECNDLTELKGKMYFNLFLVDWKEYSHDSIMDDFNFFCDIDEGEEYDKEELIDCLKETEHSVINRAEGIYYEIIDRFEYKEQIQIYRVIGLDKDETIEFVEKVNKQEIMKGYKGLGISWSWDKETCISYGKSNVGVLGKKVQYILLTGIVKSNEVDWSNTLVLNTNLAIGEDEKEIRIKKKGFIRLMEIEILNTNEKYNVDVILPSAILGGNYRLGVGGNVRFWDFEDSFGEDDGGLESIANDKDFSIYYERWLEGREKYQALNEEERKKIRKRVRGDYYDAIDGFSDFDEEFIYRQIFIPKTLIDNFIGLLRKGGFIEGYNGIGLYWGMSEHSAESYFYQYKGSDFIPILIKAKFNPDIVNWKATIFKFLEADRKEYEIQLKKNQMVFVINVSNNSETYLINFDIISYYKK